MERTPAWAARLRERRKARGWSYTDMARALASAATPHERAHLPYRTSLRRQIRGWEAGEHKPSERYRLLYARVFNEPEEAIFAAEQAPPFEAVLSLRLHATPGAGVLPVSGTAPEVAAAIRACSAHIVALDVRLGARDMVDTVVRAAAHAHRTAHTRFPADRDVLAAAAEAQQIAGWVAFDAERQDLSRRMSLEALLTARTAGDRSMEYFVLGQLAMQAIHMHRPAEAAQICDTVLHETGTQGSVRTLFTLRAARAASQTGEHTRARELIGQTRSRYLDGPRSGDPAWAWWLTEGEISWHHAMICADTGQWGHAAEHFAVAAAAETAAGYGRGASVSQACLLWALAQAGDWAEAERVLVHDVLPRRGEAVSGRAERLLMAAARLLDDARERPSLREAARELIASS
jgi:transcriptional regulator with XRE-family HTH domain